MNQILVMFLVVLSQLILACEQPEPATPVKVNTSPYADQYITFKIIGLYSDVNKQVEIYCGGFNLDTVVSGNFTYRVPVHQEIMHSVMRVRTLQPISEKLIIEAQGSEVSSSSSCEWLKDEIKWTFWYDK